MVREITSIKELPMKCATYIEEFELVGLITRGLPEYVPMYHADYEFVDQFNKKNKVDLQTRYIMEKGASLGWDHPTLFDVEN
jgi:hypothetical protein